MYNVTTGTWSNIMTLNIMTFPCRHPFFVTVFVATAIACHAQDPLDSWARRIVPGFTGNLSAVAYGNGVFVAVGDNSTVARSTDGVEWTISTAGAYGNLARVRFLDDQFMVVGSSDKLLLSPDGINWTALTLPAGGIRDVAYGNGTFLVAGPSMYVSTNGSNWQPTVARVKNRAAPPGDIDLYPDSLVFGNGHFVATPGFPLASQPWNSASSSNGIDWAEGSGAPSSSPAGRGDLLFAGNVFLGSGPAVSLSTNGISWCCSFGGHAPLNSQGVGLAHGEGSFIWVHQPFLLNSEQHPYIYSSTNGSAWVTRFARPQFFPPGTPDEVRQYYESMKGQARGAAFGNGTFVIVGEAGYVVQSGNLGGAPLILVQPQDRGAVVGNPATFSVQAAGGNPLAYQWFHNDSPIANATNTSYTISAVAANDTGGYKVVITNSVGSVTSRVAQLSISFLAIQNYAGIKLLGVVGRTYRIEATPVSGPVNWQTLTNMVLPASPYIWIDYGSPAAGQRLYRAAELP
jgi:hypothetical protein